MVTCLSCGIAFAPYMASGTKDSVVVVSAQRDVLVYANLNRMSCMMQENSPDVKVRRDYIAGIIINMLRST